VWCSSESADLAPFPTRRSSDLGGGGDRAVGVGEVAGAGVGGGTAGVEGGAAGVDEDGDLAAEQNLHGRAGGHADFGAEGAAGCRDRKSTRLNSSHVSMSYAAFC